MFLDILSQLYFSFPKEEVDFIIQKGDSVRKVGENLKEKDLIRNRLIFEGYVLLRGLEKKIRSGKYRVIKGESIKKLVEKFIEEGNFEEEIRIIEGWSAKEIGGYLENKGIISQEEFLAGISNIQYLISNYPVLEDKPKGASLEGYLFPDTYRIYKKATLEEIIKKMLDNFDKKLNQELRDEIKKQGRTIFEVITLASIIEKEVPKKEDKFLISGIFQKRLKYGIPLQADSTINYFTGKKLRQATLEDIKIDNPYNTYKYKGLPPGPISNPGLDSILASIYPKESDYWYFLNKEDGTTVYSKTFEEHIKNKLKYLR